MINLDTINLDKADPEGMYHDLIRLGNNFIEGWQSMSKLPIPSHYIKCKKIIITGMGGSGMAGRLALGLSWDYSRIPIIIVSNYNLPEYADSESLVVGVSYSGETEEILNCFIDGYRRGARLIGIGTGSKLESLARKYQVPFYRHPKLTCGQPRIAALLHFGAVLAILNKLGLSEFSNLEIINARNILEDVIAREWNFDVPTENNQAKKIALNSFDKIPVVWGADHLEPVAHQFKANFNENSKSLSYFEPLPEMNHKSLAGSEFPKPLIRNIFHLVLKSKFNHSRNILRSKLTADFFKRRKYQTELVEFPEAQNPLAEILLGSALANFSSFYLGILYGINPAPVEAVAEFKKRLDSDQNSEIRSQK